MHLFFVCMATFLLFQTAWLVAYVSVGFTVITIILIVIFFLAYPNRRKGDTPFTESEGAIFGCVIILSIAITVYMLSDSEDYIDYMEANIRRLEVIKDCNPNLTEKEAEIIAENIGIIDYMPLFLDYRAKKNVEKENLKMEQWTTEKRQQKTEEEKNKKLLDDFLSKKCNQGAEKC